MDLFRQRCPAEEASALPSLDTSFSPSFTSAPRTPEPLEARSSPPPLAEPPRIRIKRRRPALNTGSDQAQQPRQSMDRLPSIELSESADPTHILPSTEDAPSDEKMLSPVLGSMHFAHPRFASPPRTPVSKGYFDNFDWLAGRQTPMGADLTRPSSAFSQLSDSSSSFSSNSSSGTFTTVTDGCFTPLSERKDSLQESHLASPVQFVSAKKEGKKRAKKSRNEIRWTREMEDHLWRCYLSYLQDPTVTPFKTLPGVPPPIGVCHRVAHTARKTWRGRRARLAPVVEEPSSPFMSLDGTVMRRGVSAPACAVTEEPLSPLMQPWPRESATRRHLRTLCRSKPTLSPHYQRLMQSRSPSPMESSSRGHASSQSAAEASSSAFSTRDLNIDLTTSTAASMQPSGPLAQLASDSVSSTAASLRPSPIHQKSQSLEHDLSFSLPANHAIRSQSPRRLASPFVERRNTVTTPTPTQPHTFLPTPLQSSQISSHKPSPTTAAPAAPELHHPQPRPLSNSMKRRAQYPLGDEYLSSDPEARLDFLTSLFADPANHNSKAGSASGLGSGKRRVRSRGFSVGAGAIRHPSSSTHGAAAQRHISNLFCPPPAEISAAGERAEPERDTQPMALDERPTLAPPPSIPSFTPMGATSASDNVPRLGSPFVPSFSLSNTFPRNVFPAGVRAVSGAQSGGGSAPAHSHSSSGPANGDGNGTGSGSLDDPFI